MLVLAGLKPMHSCCINCDSFLCCDVGTVFQVIVLSFLLSFQVKPGQTSEIFLADSLVDSCSSADPLSVVVGCVSPPISLCLHISDNHVFYCSRQTRDFPRDICFPATPGLAKMLQNCFRFVLLNSFRHHIVDVFDYSCSKLKVILTFYALFGNCLCNTFGVSALKLPCKQIA